MVRLASLLGLLAASPAVAAQAGPSFTAPSASEPQMQVSGSNFTLPIVDYKTPAGTWKRGRGIIIGRDISPNTSVGLGLFRMRPKFQDGGSNVPMAGKSRKVAIGVSVRF